MDNIDDLPTITVGSGFSAVRRPRALIKVNGVAQTPAVVKNGDVAVPGWISWTVSSNSFYEADTFRVSFAVSALPIANDANWFSMQKQMFVEIFAGFPSNPDSPDISELDSLIYGRVDDIRFNPKERTIDLTGRDLTAVFIDSKIAAEYQDKTASDIATLLANSHGLTPIVTPTTDKVGTYYKHDQIRLQATRSEWDELAYLARQEAFVVYVSGHELHFEPNPIDGSNPYDILWQAPTDSNASPTANVMELGFERSLTVAKGITVTARSASLTKKTPTVQSYPAAPKAIAAGKATPFQGTQSYFFTMSAGKTAVEVEAYAKAQYDIIVSHEMKMTARMPADDVLQIKRPIRVTGTGTAWDQTYFPRVITREMSIDEGYDMTVEAQNTSPDLQPET